MSRTTKILGFSVPPAVVMEVAAAVATGVAMVVAVAVAVATGAAVVAMEEVGRT